ncbi:adenine/guanine phosphoribosyltransferase-like PRPP-binding protein [Kitasatospora sp. GP82]|nr:phosphoribosyltransferase domain-containing protein [Kitasatospora sp. GP82]MDH6126734.1 adenine/guanine phosphoribosyltransferase-like PRPP-binding protein [Kitasatospora sp. GP82]
MTAVPHVAPAPWTGQWVTDRLGLGLTGSPALPELIGLALRANNPKRAHLLVSQVLGKHIPQRPAVVHRVGVELGQRVRELLGQDDAGRAVVLGYAETATALGHSVADGLDAPYLHSTRRPVAGVTPVGGFEEEHSHATSHLLLPEHPAFLAGDGPLVLVDDEFSTGTTVLNTIRALHADHPRSRYVVVALVDLRTDADRDRLAEAAAELGARVDLVATAVGGVELPADLLPRAQALIAAAEPSPLLSDSVLSDSGVPNSGSVLSGSALPGSPPSGPALSGSALPGSPPSGPALPGSAPVVRVEPDWPEDLPDGGRHGFTRAHRQVLEALLPELAADLAPVVSGRNRVLVLGFEELMYVPLRLAGALAELLEREPGRETVGAAEPRVRFSTTTRSPVLAVDDPGYPIRTRLAFPAHDAPADGSAERFAYNVAPGADPDRRFDAIVLVVDGPADTPALHEGERALIQQLRRVTDQVVLVVLPSYRPRTPR